jgi:hypothetical protein
MLPTPGNIDQRGIEPVARESGRGLIQIDEFVQCRRLKHAHAHAVECRLCLVEPSYFRKCKAAIYHRLDVVRIQAQRLLTRRQRFAGAE